MSTDLANFDVELRKFWSFLDGSNEIRGIIEDLKNRDKNSEIEGAIGRILEGDQIYYFDTDLKSALAGTFILEACVQAKQNSPLWMKLEMPSFDSRRTSDRINRIKENFVVPFYDFIYERLEDGDVILSLLLRYKHKCEWFQRDYLYKKWDSKQVKGEDSVAWHLYEYLFDQGLNFTIETRSISGKADLVSRDLVADAKIFKSSSSTNYISKGFKQVYTYLGDYNQSIGYLIIYLTGNVDLQISFEDEKQIIPFITYNNKTIFLLIVDIYPHENSASKRGSLKPVVITEDDLIARIKN